MSNYLTRREFFSALAASVVVAGCPLPVGFPTDLIWTAAGANPLPPGTYAALILDIETREANEGMTMSLLVNGRIMRYRRPGV